MAKYSSDGMLQMFGLQRRRPASYIFSGIGLLGFGMLTGAALGVIFAPRPGYEMRRQVGEKFSTFGHQVGDAARNVARKLKRQAGATKDDLSDALADLRDNAYGNNGYSGTATRVDVTNT